MRHCGAAVQLQHRCRRDKEHSRSARRRSPSRQRCMRGRGRAAAVRFAGPALAHLAASMARGSRARRDQFCGATAEQPGHAVLQDRGRVAPCSYTSDCRRSASDKAASDRHSATAIDSQERFPPPPHAPHPLSTVPPIGVGPRFSRRLVKCSEIDHRGPARSMRPIRTSHRTRQYRVTPSRLRRRSRSTLLLASPLDEFGLPISNGSQPCARTDRGASTFSCRAEHKRFRIAGEIHQHERSVFAPVRRLAEERMSIVPRGSQKTRTISADGDPGGVAPGPPGPQPPTGPRRQARSIVPANLPYRAIAVWPGGRSGSPSPASPPTRGSPERESSSHHNRSSRNRRSGPGPPPRIPGGLGLRPLAVRRFGAGQLDKFSTFRRARSAIHPAAAAGRCPP